MEAIHIPLRTLVKECHRTVMEVRRMEQGEDFYPWHHKLEPGESQILQLPLLDMKVLGQGGRETVLGFEMVLALTYNEAWLCKKLV